LDDLVELFAIGKPRETVRFVRLVKAAKKGGLQLFDPVSKGREVGEVLLVVAV